MDFIFEFVNFLTSYGLLVRVAVLSAVAVIVIVLLSAPRKIQKPQNPRSRRKKKRSSGNESLIGYVPLLKSYSPFVRVTLLVIVALIVTVLVISPRKIDEPLLKDVDIQKADFEGSLNQQVTGSGNTVISQGNTVNQLSRDQFHDLLIDYKAKEHLRLQAQFPYGYVLFGYVNEQVIFTQTPKELEFIGGWETSYAKLDRGSNIVHIYLSYVSAVTKTGTKIMVSDVRGVVGNKRGYRLNLSYSNPHLMLEVLDDKNGVYALGFVAIR